MYLNTICVNLRVSTGGRLVSGVIAFGITKIVIPMKSEIQGSQGVAAFRRGGPFGYWPDDIFRASGHWIPAFAGIADGLVQAMYDYENCLFS